MVQEQKNFLFIPESLLFLHRAADSMETKHLWSRYRPEVPESIQGDVLQGMRGWMKDPQCAWDKRMGLPGGLEGVQAPVHGRDCSDSLHGACGWAVLPSCMPASRGHKLQQKIWAWSLSPPDHFFHFNRWASRGHSCHLFTSGQSLFSLMYHLSC